MQTFLPYSDFRKSANALDNKRLGKQRIEAWQVYQCLTGQGSLRWKNHPAVQMWKGFEHSLLLYGWRVCREWKRRGFKDTLEAKFFKELSSRGLASVFCMLYPPWLGDEKFHAAYRSNLLRKDFKYYSQFGWTESIDLPYTWGK